MNTIGFYLWLIPVLFMIHEFEEIFMIEAWYEGHKEKINKMWPTKKPFGLDRAGPYLTATIAIGIFCEYILVIVICLLCALFDNYYAWFAFAIGLILTSVLLHGRDFIKFKGYTPGVITSVILIPPVIWALYQANGILHYGVWWIVLATIVLNIIMGLTAFKLLHGSMPAWSNWLLKISRSENKEQRSG
jgi:hypothetical protein